MASLATIKAAVNDGELRDRLTSAAYAAGVESPEQWVSANIGRLVSTPMPKDGPGEGQQLADVFAFGASEKAKAQKAYNDHMAQAPAVPGAASDTFIADVVIQEALTTARTGNAG